MSEGGCWKSWSPMERIMSLFWKSCCWSNGEIPKTDSTWTCWSNIPPSRKRSTSLKGTLCRTSNFPNLTISYFASLRKNPTMWTSQKRAGNISPAGRWMNGSSRTPALKDYSEEAYVEATETSPHDSAIGQGLLALRKRRAIHHQ